VFFRSGFFSEVNHDVGSVPVLFGFGSTLVVPISKFVFAVVVPPAFFNLKMFAETLYVNPGLMGYSIA
jgi:hypothetical protein